MVIELTGKHTFGLILGGKWVQPVASVMVFCSGIPIVLNIFTIFQKGRLFGIFVNQSTDLTTSI